MSDCTQCGKRTTPDSIHTCSPQVQRDETLPGAVLWQWRHLDTANTPNEWSEWQFIEVRNAHTDTIEDRVREYQGYIDLGYKYELRALYTEATLREAIKGVRKKALERALKACQRLTEPKMDPNDCWEAAYDHVVADCTAEIRKLLEDEQ